MSVEIEHFKYTTDEGGLVAIVVYPDSHMAHGRVFRSIPSVPEVQAAILERLIARFGGTWMLRLGTFSADGPYPESPESWQEV